MTRAERTKWAFRWWKALGISDQVCAINHCSNVCIQMDDGWLWDGDEVASMWLDGAPIELLP